MATVEASLTSILICYELALDFETFTTGTCAAAEDQENGFRMKKERI